MSIEMAAAVAPPPSEGLIEGNLAFVVSIANEYRGRGVPFEDLLAEGNLGLLEAARRYDDTIGVRFLTYAVWWIRKRILQALEEQSSVVRLPANHRKSIRAIRRTEEGLRSELGRHPRREEVRDRLASNIDGILARHRRVVSIDREHPGRDGRSRRLADDLSARTTRADDELIHGQLLDRLVQAVGRLPRVERSVIQGRYGLGHEQPRTLREIGSDMGLSRERVRQIEGRARDRLRRLLDGSSESML
jgi:RNA polymerase primary sigma factor